MPTWFDSIPENIQEFILQQPVFFVASAPLTGKHVNISPKGHPSRTFAIMNPRQVAYVDASGSGTETISHIYENGRVTMMFCSFVKAPRIVRLFCRGRVVERADADFRPLIRRMCDRGMRIEEPDGRLRGLVQAEVDASAHGDLDATTSRKKASPADVDLNPRDGAGIVGARAVIVLDVVRGHISCGFGVPLLTLGLDGNLKEGPEKQKGQQQKQLTSSDGDKGNKTNDDDDGNSSSLNRFGLGKPARSQDLYVPGGTRFDDAWDDRNTLYNALGKMVKSGKLMQYRIDNNTTSLDGLPGVRMVCSSRRQRAAICIAAWLRRIFVGQWDAVLVGFLLAVSLQVQTLVAYKYLMRGSISFGDSDVLGPESDSRWHNVSRFF